MRTFFLHTFIAFVAAYYTMKHGLTVLRSDATSSIVVFMGLFLILWLSAFLYNRAYFRKLPKGINFFFYFLKELLIANLKIAYDIITPRYNMQPAVIALPIDLKTDGEITLLAILITLTPGTLSLDVREDKKVLYVHALYVNPENLEQLKHSLKQGFERRIIELTA